MLSQGLEHDQQLVDRIQKVQRTCLELSDQKISVAKNTLNMVNANLFFDVARDACCLFCIQAELS